MKFWGTVIMGTIVLLVIAFVLKCVWDFARKYIGYTPGPTMARIIGFFRGER